MKKLFIVSAIISTLSVSACGSESQAQTEKNENVKYTTFQNYSDLPRNAQLNAEKYLGGSLNYKAIKYAFLFDRFYIYDIAPDGQCYMRTVVNSRISTMAKTECTKQVLGAIDPKRLAALKANTP